MYMPPTLQSESVSCRVRVCKGVSCTYLHASACPVFPGKCVSRAYLQLHAGGSFSRVNLTLTDVCLTLSWVCPTLAKMSLTLVRVCPTLARVCMRHDVGAFASVCHVRIPELTGVPRS